MVHEIAGQGEGHAAHGARAGLDAHVRLDVIGKAGASRERLVAHAARVRRCVRGVLRLLVRVRLVLQGLVLLPLVPGQGHLQQERLRAVPAHRGLVHMLGAHVILQRLVVGKPGPARPALVTRLLPVVHGGVS